MLFLLIAWLALAFVCSSVGSVVLSWTSGMNDFSRVGDRLIVCIWIGLGVLGCALLAVALVVPVTALTDLIIVVTAVAIVAFHKPTRITFRQVASALRRSPLLIGGLACLSLGAAFFTSQTLVWTDTGIYHAGAVLWIHNFGAVAGVALTDPYLGLTSSWFAITALFFNGDLKYDVLAVVGGFSLLILALQAVLCVARVLSRRAQQADWLIIFGSLLVGPTVIWWKLPVSPNPDLALDILPLVVAWSIVQTWSTRSVSQMAPMLHPNARLIPFIIALGATAVKISAAPLLLVTAAYYIAGSKQKLQRISSLVLVALVMLVPAAAYSFVVSGCLFFPVNICVDTVSWSIGSEVAGNLSHLIKEYARWPGTEVGRSTAGASWLPYWIKDGQSLLFVLILALASITVLVRKSTYVQRWLFFLGFTGALFVLYSAPALRFGLGYLAVLLGTTCVVWQGALRNRLQRSVILRTRTPQTLGLVTLLVVMGSVLALSRLIRPTVSRQETLSTVGLFAPPSVPRPIAKLNRVNGIDFWIPEEGNSCWMTKLPCTQIAYVGWKVMGGGIFLRDPGKGIQAGFRRATPDPTQ